MKCSRRNFLTTSAMVLTGGVSFSLLRPSFAAASVDDRYFIFVNLRGAADGMATLPPVGDPDYADLRGALAFDTAEVGLIDDGLFAFNPALNSLRPWYDAGDLLFVHAVATPYRNRSHFDGQAVLENGLADQHRTNSGWLGRALQARDNAPVAVAVDGGVPLVLTGADRVMNWSPGRTSVPSPDVVERLAALYEADARFASFADAMRTSVDSIRRLRATGTPQAASFVVAARFLTENGGPRVAVLSVDGWDTHTVQGTIKGRSQDALSKLANGLSTMRQTLGEERWTKTIILVASEFGRTARPNGSNGTDHGTGGAMMLCGGAVNGGRIVADWPGLSESALYDGRDLKPTLDMRAVLKGVALDHLRVSRESVENVVFPATSDVVPLADLVKI
ncbi:hypothetical protein GCM10011505_32780 [Tistrella bauzanensis]|uniref:DUF1501 domain-containing protein n=2 Tax=Tistrella bauzanensis TaxID=657419 RepID=A0ABQ1IQG2_9PROT|nr:DUF1501 domain-containing protein [Tistrella bauzanensis]GGB49149.1 hypothetical protein GCM10011505_32780 [Tistrella bauzanensis]